MWLSYSTETSRASYQNGLVREDHSGGYRIEPIRLGRVLVGFRPDQSRRGEVLVHILAEIDQCHSFLGGSQACGDPNYPLLVLVLVAGLVIGVVVRLDTGFCQMP